MAELDRRRIAAVLAAYSAMECRTGGSAKLYSHIHQLADTDRVETCKRIRFVNLILIVRREELACVVTAEAEGHLGKIVGSEAEELSLFSYIVSGESSSRDLDHGADLIPELGAACLYDLVSGLDNYILNELKLL